VADKDRAVADGDYFVIRERQADGTVSSRKINSTNVLSVKQVECIHTYPQTWVRCPDDDYEMQLCTKCRFSSQARMRAAARERIQREALARAATERRNRVIFWLTIVAVAAFVLFTPQGAWLFKELYWNYVSR
jgi:hypothetical protein